MWTKWKGRAQLKWWNQKAKMKMPKKISQKWFFRPFICLYQQVPFWKSNHALGSNILLKSNPLSIFCHQCKIQEQKMNMPQKNSPFRLKWGAIYVKYLINRRALGHLSRNQRHRERNVFSFLPLLQHIEHSSIKSSAKHMEWNKLIRTYHPLCCVKY